MEEGMKRSLKNLFAKAPIDVLSEIPDIAISGIALDSRKVQSGQIFAAISGVQTDGYHFISQAIANGAVAVVGNQPDILCDVPYVQIKGDTRQALAYLAAAYYDFPARKMTVIGVTGTDGKTTTTNMIYHILLKAGIKTGMISTVNAVIGEEMLDTGFHVTTPEAPEIQHYLARMVAAGVTHVVLETTSHGLMQERVTACDYDLAVITNVTHEHLDYHGSYQAYLEAKGKLFESLAQTPKKAHGNIRAAVLNKDDRSYAYLKRASPDDQISYSMMHEATLWAQEVENTPTELRYICHSADFIVQVKTPLIGIYNVSNSLAALAATVLRLNVPVGTARQALAEMPNVPGRMERISLGQDFNVIVDFAHTPNGLFRALETARGLTSERVIVVFGSAGLRDRKKRRMLPQVAIEFADLTVLTAEDPRTESLNEILADMAVGAELKGGVEGQNFWRIPDRGEAIRFALNKAQTGDLVIVCGKGHEQSMCFGSTEHPWDDRTAVRAGLSELLNIEGPAMPYLPTQDVVS